MTTDDGKRFQHVTERLKKSFLNRLVEHVGLINLLPPVRVIGDVQQASRHRTLSTRHH